MATDVLTPPVTVAPRGNRNRHQRGRLRWLILALAVGLAVLMMIPFVIMVLNAFKSPAEPAPARTAESVAIRCLPCARSTPAPG